MTKIGPILTKFSKSLTSLKLKNIQISNNSLPSILQCQNLEILNLSNSLIRYPRSSEGSSDGPEDEFYYRLCTSLLKLRKLNLNHSMADSHRLKHISQLKHLTDLSLRDTQVTSIEFLYDSNNLKMLDLSDCSIQEMVKNLSILLSRLIEIKKIGLNGFEQLVKDVAASYRVELL